MELLVIYLFFILIEIMCNFFCEVSNWQKLKFVKWYCLLVVMEGYIEFKDGILYLNIEEDSDIVFDLVRKVFFIFNFIDDILV